MRRFFRLVAPMIAPWLVLSCGRAPERLCENVGDAIKNGDLERVRALVDTRYTDPLGDQSALLSNLESLLEQGPLAAHFLELSRNGLHLAGRHEIRFDAEESWKVEGLFELEITPGLFPKLKSGLLTDFRDIYGLVAAMTRARARADTDAIRTLLHPQYREGDIDLTAATAWLRGADRGVGCSHQITHRVLDLRGNTAHLDEWYRFGTGSAKSRQQVARFSLRKSAGRWKISSGLIGAFGRHEHEAQRVLR